jgi:alpha-galactosidase
LFNARDPGDGFDRSKALFTSEILRGRSSRAAEVTADIRGARKLFLMVTTTADGFDNDHTDWIEPRLIGPGGEKKLTDLKWVKATAGWGVAAVGKNASGQDLTRDGKPVAFGIGTHAPSVIEYDLPEGYETFKATGVLDPGSRGRGSVQLFVYSDKAVVPMPENATVAVSLSDAGFAGPVRIRDLWSHQDLGVFEKSFSRDIAFHGAGLYRISPVR